MPPHFRPDHKTALDSLLLGIPGVTAGQMFGHPSYKIAGKVFASVMEDGITIKLPEDTRQAMLERENVSTFAPMGTPMREWVLVRVADAGEYVAYRDYLEQVLQFVAAEADQKKPRGSS